MVEGLKVTVPALELRQLCEARALHHEERAKVYAEQVRSMQENKVEGMKYTNGDPVQVLEDRRAQHLAEASDLRFIGTHVDVNESYLLDYDALRKLGIVTSSRY